MDPRKNNNSNIIIIKKSRKKADGYRAGAWKAAYADFVTAMMALFIVLWSLGQSEEVKQAISNYFNDPFGVAIGRGPSIIEGNQIEHKILNGINHKEMERQRLAKMGNELLQQLQDSKEFKNILDQIEIQVIDEGLRIEIMESNDDVFFDIGTVRLNTNANLLMHIIGKQLSKLNNKIVIEGHTDSRPYISNINNYTNYELSTDRANAARRALIEGGVVKEQINEIRGYADNRLRDSNNPYHVVNRRISIILKYSDPI